MNAPQIPRDHASKDYLTGPSADPDGFNFFAGVIFVLAVEAVIGTFCPAIHFA
jgi:hypothetical protein